MNGFAEKRWRLHSAIDDLLHTRDDSRAVRRRCATRRVRAYQRIDRRPSMACAAYGLIVRAESEA